VSPYLAPEKETVPRKNDYDPGEAGDVRDSTKNICLTQATGATIKITGGRRSPEVEDGATIRVTKEAPRDEEIDYSQIASNVTQIISVMLTVPVLSGYSEWDRCALGTVGPGGRYQAPWVSCRFGVT
jgi:hypothetical protein